MIITKDILSVEFLTKDYLQKYKDDTPFDLISYDSYFFGLRTNGKITALIRKSSVEQIHVKKYKVSNQEKLNENPEWKNSSMRKMTFIIKFKPNGVPAIRLAKLTYF